MDVNNEESGELECEEYLGYKAIPSRAMEGQLLHCASVMLNTIGSD